MKEDPIVEETHCIRREIAAQFGGDIHAFFEHLRERERVDEGEVVTLERNAPEEVIPVGRPR
jgi:hypothetical protein